MFEQAVHPWLVIRWTEHDYGVDALVEIARPLADGTGDAEATSRRFVVQLKATEGAAQNVDGSFHLDVPPGKIRYWTDSTEPVLLVGCSVPDRSLVWRWLDDRLIDDLTARMPGWLGQKTVRLHIGKRPLDADALREIEHHVLSRPRHVRHVLAPGTYYRLNTEARQIVAEVLDIARTAGMSSARTRLERLQQSVQGATYVVAVTGPSRAGKSTLLNGLLGKNITPVGRFPTTAVAVLVTAGAEERVLVHFADGRTESAPLDQGVVARYATQDQNPDNAADVRLVHVSLVSELLERGIALADAPGLHDASDAIRRVTAQALQMAHAIVYLIDASPMREGGFSFNVHMRDDLQRLRSSAERLVVVLNKTDVLTEEQRLEVRDYLERELRKYDLWSYLPVPPILISAQAGVAWRDGGSSGPSPLAELDESLWTHLLRTGSTGVHRLHSSVAETWRAVAELRSLIEARRADEQQSSAIRAWIADAHRAETVLLGECRNRRIDDVAWANDLLRQRSASVVAAFASRFHQLSLSEGPLPNTELLQAEVTDALLTLYEEYWVEVRGRFEAFCLYIANRVESLLQKGRAAADPSAAMRLVVPGAPLQDKPDPDWLAPEPWLWTILGGLFGLVLGEAWPWLLAAGGWFVGLMLGEKARRKRALERIRRHVAAHLESAAGFLQTQVEEKIALQANAMAGYVRERLGGYATDLEKQLGATGASGGEASGGRPLAVLEQSLERLVPLDARLSAVARELKPGSDVGHEPADQPQPPV